MGLLRSTKGEEGLFDDAEAGLALSAGAVAEPLAVAAKPQSAYGTSSMSTRRLERRLGEGKMAAMVHQESGEQAAGAIQRGIYLTERLSVFRDPAK